MTRKTLVAWSSGKDAAWMLSRLRRDPSVEIAGLLTTFDEGEDQVAMHRVPRSLVEAQARAADLPLWPVSLPWPCPDATYEARMGAAIERARAQGIAAVAFGDLHLGDIRTYRERQLAGSGVEPMFPLWCGSDATAALAREMIDGGLSAVITCVDTRRLDGGFAGRRFDHDLLEALPETVDACGERGEFHTFCTAAPCFDRDIPVHAGVYTQRDGFRYCALTASRAETSA